MIELALSGVGSQLQNRMLAVPIYQRPYAWTDENVREYWSDLITALSKGSAEYFLGTIVIAKEGVPGRDTVIDGQQRLATTQMLLASVRDEYQARGDNKRAQIIQSRFLSADDLATGSIVPRLQLSSDDDAFFRQLVIESKAGTTSLRKSHKRIEAAYALLRERISELTTASGSDWSQQLIGLVEFVTSNLRAIVLDVAGEADAFLIFETLNDRGADLTVADLLKNYLFGRAGPNLDIVRDSWVRVVGALELATENGVLTEFIRHYWSSRSGTVRERELYRSIRDSVTSPAQAVQFVAELEKAARLYAALLNSDHEQWSVLGSASRGHVETYLRLDLAQVRPLMLAAMQHFTPAEQKNLLRALTAWSVRGLIVGGIGGGTYEKAYCDVAVKIRTGDVKTVDDVYEEISRLIPTDDEFSAEFAVTRVPKSNLARYYLIALEQVESGQKEPELVPNANEEQVNLEHVLPKSAVESDWGANFSPEERLDWVFRVGNLALLAKGANGKIGNKSFGTKKPILGASNFKLTARIGDCSEWSPSAIQARQEYLAALALKAWPRRPAK